MSEKMLACPFKRCDGEIVLQVVNHQHYVECVGCGARGPIFTRPELAIEWWNTRHDGAEGDELAFKQGYYLAVANIIRLHDAATIAEDVLASHDAVDFTGIDSEDVKILKPIAAETERKRLIRESPSTGEEREGKP